MRYLLDTGLLIRHLRGQKSTVQLLRGLAKTNRLCISALTRLELRAGAHPNEMVATQKLVSRFVTLDLNADIAESAGEIMAQSKDMTRPLLVPDAIIAATALIHNISLVTFNAQDFEAIPNLSLHPLST